ncbi:hypothetical protein LMB33_01400 [Limosilactobacillus reuteri]|nr:hypothetical protein [Limosilactobacillus reuteri]MCC4329068.1 hypothetical protein [Limosilactobacillus reuteri]MCC4351626.1 hypothetical protein [Limosilactobacillus reuteri]MCC4376497.1 hypothetical protein [Limosilactobacillus reuteri]
MEQWLLRQPLILTPTIPLMWTVGWLCTMSAYIILGGQPPSPNQLQDSVLLISAVILVINIYNLILVYQRTEKYRNLSTYAPRALLLAIILIISIVLAWGQPKVVLIPSYLNIWVMIFIVLNFLQALLGQFFALLERSRSRRRLASMYWPIVVLYTAGIVISPSLEVHNGWTLPFIIGDCILLLFFIARSWQEIPRILIKVHANNSIIYELLVGINLATIISTVVSGVLFIIFNFSNTEISIVAAYFALSPVINGISGLIIGAMQRYNNDYRYGHVKGHPQRYIYCGIFLVIVFLILGFILKKN